jgi:muramoyltetrapeptide carboxypeptidase
MKKNLKQPAASHPSLGIWAGSSPAPKADYQAGLQRFKELKIEVIIPSEIKKNATRAWNKNFNYLAGPDSEKVSSFLKLLKNPQVHDIFCVRGGYGTLRLLKLLDKIDFSKWKAKRLWGFSDYTTLQNYFFDKWGWTWVHSPMLTGSSFQRPNSIEKNGWPAPFGNGSRTVHPLKTLFSPQWKQKSATLLGGNLASLVCLMGTSWEPRPKEKFFLFIEDVSEAPRFIDRYLHQLCHSRYFENCVGILTGHFTDSPRAEKIIEKYCQENKIPLFCGILAGHESPNLPLPMGHKVSVQIKDKKSAQLRVPELVFE